VSIVVLTEGETRTIERIGAINRRPARRAARVFREGGFPGRRNESWRWSDLKRALGEVDSVHVTPGDAQHVHQYQPTNDADDPIAMLAGALAGKLTFGVIAAGKRETLAFDDFGVRALKIYGDAVIVERLGVVHGLAASSLSVAVVGNLTRIVLHEGSDDDIALSRSYFGVTGQFRQFVVSTGAKLARFETTVDLQAEGASAEVNAVYLAGNGRHADFTSVITHQAPNCVTRQLVKGVARKGGRGVFQGKIVVERGAQKTDARQHHRGLLLEDGAEIFAKPELMIHADDVQCAHGNTAGGLDERALFYMRSRGIPEAEARALLIEAFLVETIPESLPEELRSELSGLIHNWLAEAPAGTPAVQA
jgi:Fe-S cluster assembly protein SufD